MLHKMYIYRAAELTYIPRLPVSLRPHARAFIKTLDELSPGWKRARVTWIVGAQDATGLWSDSVYELPGNISVRGWDMTGAIHKGEP